MRLTVRNSRLSMPLSIAAHFCSFTLARRAASSAVIPSSLRRRLMLEASRRRRRAPLFADQKRVTTVMA